VVVLGCLLSIPAAAFAGGIFVPGYGARAMGRAGTFVAKADDPSALHYNPAGFAKQTGTVIHLGFNFINLSQEFERAGTYDTTVDARPWEGQPFETVEEDSKPAIGFGGFQGIPLLAVSTDFGLAIPIRFGLGLFAENGFPERAYKGQDSYNFESPTQPPPPQRYDVLEQDVSTAFPALAVAYQVAPNFDIGVRVEAGFAGLNATSYLWGIRNYEESVSQDGEFKADVKDDFMPGFGIGLMYRPTPSWEIGARYTSEKNFNGKGNGASVVGSAIGLPGQPETIEPENDFTNCAKGGTVTALKTCINFKLPMNAAIGGRWILRDAKGGELADVELDVQWENWSRASDFEIIVDGKSGTTGLPLNTSFIRHGLQDTFSVRLGGDYNVPIGVNKLALRGGAAYDTAAAPNSWTRLDLDGFARTSLTAGASFETSRLRIDVGGGLVIEGDRTVAQCNPELGSLGCDGSGVEAANADRTSPDPAQPLQGPNNQVESPFNGGKYSQGYVMFAVGVTTWF
jgi:long-chain fatty acid transport protein